MTVVFACEFLIVVVATDSAALAELAELAVLAVLAVLAGLAGLAVLVVPVHLVVVLQHYKLLMIKIDFIFKMWSPCKSAVSDARAY